jgi:hypothetical protein
MLLSVDSGANVTISWANGSANSFSFSSGDTLNIQALDDTIEVWNHSANTNW